MLCNGTCVVFDQFLQCLKLGSCGDVVATVIKLADFVVLHIVTLHVIPIAYGQRVSPCQKERIHACSYTRNIHAPHTMLTALCSSISTVL